MILTFFELEGRKIIHRDLKLDNILFKSTKDRIIFKLADFSEGKKIDYY